MRKVLIAAVGVFLMVSAFASEAFAQRAWRGGGFYGGGIRGVGIVGGYRNVGLAWWLACGVAADGVIGRIARCCGARPRSALPPHSLPIPHPYGYGYGYGG